MNIAEKLNRNHLFIYLYTYLNLHLYICLSILPIVFDSTLGLGLSSLSFLVIHPVLIMGSSWHGPQVRSVVGWPLLQF